jgi:starvation-inducible DNA-binding protein
MFCEEAIFDNADREAGGASKLHRSDGEKQTRRTMPDAIAGRLREVGGGTTTISIAHIARCQRVRDNDEDYVCPADTLEELRKDNESLVASMRETHALCDQKGDLAGASLLENWIDERERRVWFLFETTRHAI